mgnify:CR=1 FL=1
MEASQFKSDQYVRFCPGCGDHAICMALQKAMAQIGVPTHETVVISGIGCSSRMPHYLNTYGFNTIHGRGAAIATGVKTAHPELTVWQMTGDGDCLAIGGNHFIHSLRRNVDLNIRLEVQPLRHCGASLRACRVGDGCTGHLLRPHTGCGHAYHRGLHGASAATQGRERD